MDDTFFANGMRWLADRLYETSEVDAEYVSARGTRLVKAVVGKTDQLDETEQNVDLRTFRFDFIIRVDDLDGKPEAGDRILCRDKRFEVVNLIAGRCFEYVDSLFETYRVHAQQV